MVIGRYLDTTVGRLYLAVDGEYVVRLSGGESAEGDVVVEKGGSLAEGDVAVEKGGPLAEGDVTALDERLLGDSAGQEVQVSLCLLDRLVQEVKEYMEGTRREFDLKVCISGTPFQERVWNALREIPYGKTCTYGELAGKVGSPKGARAVGMACHQNPVMLLIPCHRVIGSTGKLVGFGGGLPMKEYLLKLESGECGRTAGRERNLA